MTFCPVTADLNRYLADCDRADAIDRALDAKVAGWMGDSDAIAGAWDEIEEDGPAIMGVDIALALTGHPDDRGIRAERLLALVEQKVRDKLAEKAPDALEAEAENARIDAAEALADARADRYADAVDYL